MGMIAAGTARCDAARRGGAARDGAKWAAIRARAAREAEEERQAAGARARALAAGASPAMAGAAGFRRWGPTPR